MDSAILGADATPAEKDREAKAAAIDAAQKVVTKDTDANLGKSNKEKAKEAKAAAKVAADEQNAAEKKMDEEKKEAVVKAKAEAAEAKKDADDQKKADKEDGMPKDKDGKPRKLHREDERWTASMPQDIIDGERFPHAGMKYAN